jgi:hypothetical protein
MRATECEPGSVILAGDGGPYPSDWIIGCAVRIERRFWRTVAVDEQGQRWSGVKVLPPGEYELVEGQHHGVPYPAARLLRGRLDRAERPRAGTVGAVAGPVSAGPTSSRRAIGASRRQAVTGATAQ